MNMKGVCGTTATMSMKFPELSQEERIRLLAPRPGKVRAVIDSDTYNEVDDQFAIAYALRSPERLDVRAVYAAPFTSMAGVGMIPEATGPAIGMELSYKEIYHVMELMGEDPTGRVFRGSTEYLKSAEEPVESEAARDLVKKAMESDEPLYVLAIGAITNVASAILMEPEIIKKIVVVWLGGQPYLYPYAIEFNLSQDIYASQLMFDSGVALVHVPCMSVASHLTTTPMELRHYLSGSKIGSYLTEIVSGQCVDRELPPGAADFMRESYLKGVDDYSNEVLGQFSGPRKMAWSRTIWDISVVAYMVNPGWVPSKLIPSPRLMPDFSWVREEGRHLIRHCNYISRNPVFGDLFHKLGK